MGIKFIFLLIFFSSLILISGRVDGAGEGLLITEVQISPIDDRFIEIYNPLNSNINLSNFYIQRKTETGNSWSSLISTNEFEGKTIGGGGHFLIRNSSGADINTRLTLTKNNAIRLRDLSKSLENRTIDLLGWGNNSQEFLGSPCVNPQSGQSISRSWNISSTIYLNGEDNSKDFFICEYPGPGENGCLGGNNGGEENNSGENKGERNETGENNEGEEKEDGGEETINNSGEEVEINSASREELEKIRGIGPVYAEKIISLREICSLEDLLEVEGIGEATIEGIIEQDIAWVDPPEFCGEKDKDDEGADEEENDSEDDLDRIEINEANKEELERIVNIGPIYVERIIEYRESHNFSSLRDLNKIEGIGEEIIEDIILEGRAYVSNKYSKNESGERGEQGDYWEEGREVIKLNGGKDIKSKKEKHVYRSNLQYMKENSIYVFSFLCVVIIAVLLIKPEILS